MMFELTNFSWRALLDVVVIATLIFLAYHTMRLLGTWKIAVGVLIAAAFFMLSALLQLEGVMWIYSNLSPVALIALIVVFQPEIRKLLSKVASIRGPGGKPMEAEDVRQLARAMVELATQRRGAILVLPGRDVLDEWVSGGVVLSAQSSVHLLLSIFDPHSPGHDGAVVLGEGGIARFGVRLPNSTSLRLSEDFGTRHQASLGLSEVTDALVLTVSEEKGTMYAFHNGRMELLGGQDEIVSTVNKHLVTMGQNLFQTRLKERKAVWIVEFMLSLVLSFLLWFSVTAPADQVVERFVTVPVQYVLPPDRSIDDEAVASLSVRVAGASSALAGLDPHDLAVTVDVSKLDPGIATVPIGEDLMNLPAHIRLIESKPPEIKLSISWKVVEEFLVSPQLLGKPPVGMVIESIQVRPAYVPAVVRPSDTEDEEPNVTTTPIVLSFVRSGQVINSKIVAPANLRPVDQRWPDVEVIVHFMESNTQ